MRKAEALEERRGQERKIDVQEGQEREVKAQGEHEEEREESTREESVEGKKEEMNSMHEESHVSKRHMSWWRGWIRVHDGPHMRSARGDAESGEQPDKRQSRFAKRAGSKRPEGEKERERDRKGGESRESKNSSTAAQRRT